MTCTQQNRPGDSTVASGQSWPRRGSVPGGAAGLQAREGRQTALSGFDSHSLPPVHSSMVTGVGDAKRPFDAVMLRDGHVLARYEGMLGEAEDRLVVLLARSVGEQPLIAAMVHQHAVFVVLVGPEAAHRALRLLVRPS